MNKIIQTLSLDENFHFPNSGEVYKKIQEKQEFDKKLKTVKKFFNEIVHPAIDVAIKDGNTFVYVDLAFKESLSPELQEIVLDFLEYKNYKIIDREFQNGDTLCFEIGF